MCYLRRGSRGYLSGFGAISTASTITTTGNVLAARFLAGTDTAAAPGHSWQADGDTGLYNNAADSIGASAGNANVYAAAQATINLNAPIVAVQAGGDVYADRFLAEDDDSANPAFSYQNDLDTGMARLGANVITLGTGGSFKVYADTNDTSVGSNNVNFIIGSKLALSGDLSPAQITANQTDYAPTGITSTSRIRVDLDADRTINSLSGGADGRRIRILNLSAFTLTLLHDDGATGTAAMRFLCPNEANVAVRKRGSVDVEYDSTSSRWRVLGI